MVGGVLISLRVVGAAKRILALLVYAIVAGALVGLVLHTWLGILTNDLTLNPAGLGVAMLTTAATVVGLHGLLGSPEIIVGAVITMLVANPLSGAALPYQFYPEPWGAIGQYFVPGAASALMRELSYFPDADSTQHRLTLGAWAVGGLLLVAVGHFRGARTVVD